MPILKHQPLRRQVVAAACISLVPLGYVAGWAANRTRLERQSELQREAQTLAGVIASLIEPPPPGTAPEAAPNGITPAQNVLSRLTLPEGSMVIVRDGARRMVARSREGGDLDRFVGQAPVPRSSWNVEVSLPKGGIADQLAPLWGRNIALAFSAFAGTLLLSLMMARYMRQYLGRLRTAVDRIANGDLSPPEPHRMPNLELEELHEAFVTMAANLRNTRDALDSQLEEERRMKEMLQSLQSQVVRQERLAAVGLLVSGVAHELNNPLQAILGSAELLERYPQLGPDAREELACVKNQSQRARDIIRNLSRFGTQQSAPPATVDLREVIAEAVQLRRGELESAGITLEIDFGSERTVHANFTELEQVTLNFIINAQQAIEGHRTDGRRIVIRLFDAGKTVRLEVRDNGPGVRTEDEPKLFQPFFTTKPVGRGTGLGLSVSYGIIDSYGGIIGYLRNEWGGATFFFELPAAARDSKPRDGARSLRSISPVSRAFSVDR